MWICAHCGEQSGEDFGLCWKCSEPREGVVLVAEEPAEAAAQPAPAEPIPDFAAICPRCGEPRWMEGLPVTAPQGGTWSQPAIEVEVTRQPHPLLPRGLARAELRADVCAACGHTEIFTLGAGALWDSWRLMHAPPPPPVPEQADPRGARIVLNAAPGSGTMKEHLPRAGEVVSRHMDPGGGRAWLLLKMEQVLVATMQVGGTARYQRVEADACLLRPTVVAAEDPRRWRGVALEVRWVQRGAWVEGGAVEAGGAWPPFLALATGVQA